jgi:hypothetical protein
LIYSSGEENMLNREIVKELTEAIRVARRCDDYYFVCNESLPNRFENVVDKLLSFLEEELDSAT